MAWFWLSFSDAARPAGQQFLGVSLVEAKDQRAAVTLAWAALCNPGGEVASWVIRPDELSSEQRALFDRTPKYRLLRQGELERLGHTVRRPRDG